MVGADQNIHTEIYIDTDRLIYIGVPPLRAFRGISAHTVACVHPYSPCLTLRRTYLCQLCPVLTAALSVTLRDPG